MWINYEQNVPLFRGNLQLVINVTDSYLYGTFISLQSKKENGMNCFLNADISFCSLLVKARLAFNISVYKVTILLQIVIFRLLKPTSVCNHGDTIQKTLINAITVVRITSLRYIYFVYPKFLYNKKLHIVLWYTLSHCFLKLWRNGTIPKRRSYVGCLLQDIFTQSSTIGRLVFR
jgi:hypothetical protein